jgi:hypothetical protein
MSRVIKASKQEKLLIGANLSAGSVLIKVIDQEEESISVVATRAAVKKGVIVAASKMPHPFAGKCPHDVGYFCIIPMQNSAAFDIMNDFGKKERFIICPHNVIPISWSQRTKINIY